MIGHTGILCLHISSPDMTEQHVTSSFHLQTVRSFFDFAQVFKRKGRTSLGAVDHEP